MEDLDGQMGSGAEVRRVTMATDDDHSASSEQITANEEIQMLPRGWKMRAKGKSNRVAFYRPNESQAGADKKDTFDHPVLGRLPRPWELRKKGPGKFVYYNTETGKAASRGPRRVVPPLTTTARPPPGAVVVAARTFGQQQKQQHVRKLKRQETSCVPLHDEYERTRCLDDGKGAIGGMNDGIYVVRKKVTGQLFVEKNYSGAVPHLIPLIKSEINMMKGLLHSSIIHYVASFIQDDPFRATV
ncbi:hypothetical protein SLS62_003836 [Diatrype stigma]|uniref:WW domain-containing protein n=1 Tax=Diatrype stigma TaxID=117547 RepID=A0AAN9UUE9_9PEZI